MMRTDETLVNRECYSGRISREWREEEVRKRYRKKRTVRGEHRRRGAKEKNILSYQKACRIMTHAAGHAARTGVQQGLAVLLRTLTLLIMCWMYANTPEADSNRLRQLQAVVLLRTGRRWAGTR